MPDPTPANFCVCSSSSRGFSNFEHEETLTSIGRWLVRAKAHSATVFSDVKECYTFRLHNGCGYCVYAYTAVVNQCMAWVPASVGHGL